MARRVLLVVTVLVFLGIAAVALYPDDLLAGPSDAIAETFAGTALGDPALIHGLLYGALYLVAGVLSAVLFRPGGRWLAFATCLAVALGLEFVQLVFPLGNGPEAWDVLGAAAASAIGVLVVAVIAGIRRPRLIPA